MVGRRLLPLAALVLLGLVLYAARLFQVQVVQHEIWAREAANLLRAGAIVPYHRGRILDAEGRVLVQDEDAYVLELVYRDFRREHPLGQVAHALSVLHGRPVRASEVLAELPAHGRALVSLSMEEIDRFARGEALAERGLPAVSDLAAVDAARARRASDLRFYLARLLALERREVSLLAQKRGTPEWSLPFVELAARVRSAGASAGGSDGAALPAELEARLARVPAELERLERLLALAPAEAPGLALAILLERERDALEDAMADALFQRAAGFEPRRLPPELCAALDPGFLVRALGWDRERCARWARSRRTDWEAPGGGRELRLRELVLQLELAPPEERGERLLDGLDALLGTAGTAERAPGSWRAAGAGTLSAALEQLLLAPPPSSAEESDALAPPLPWLAEAVRAEPDAWLALGSVLEALELEPRSAAAERWRAREDQPILGEEVVLELELAVEALERRLDGALRARFAGLLGEPLALGPRALTRAREQEAYVVRDRSSRPRLFAAAPSHDVVHLVSRHPERYGGLRVRATTRRSRLALLEDGSPALGALLGGVRLPGMRELVRQEEARAELGELFRRKEREPEEERRLLELAAGLVRPDERRGGSGLEVYFDRELSGRNGWRETDGLQERAEQGAKILWEPPLDGEDLRLTVDLELVRAAQGVLARPERPDEPFVDELWLANPVGAIVLMRVDGDVLVAASEPTRAHEPPPTRLGQRAHPIERTLRRMTANPPGSALKPFVAAWALEYRGLDPQARFECEPLVGGGSGWKTMRCLGQHGEVDLDEALRASCNAYFARVGDEHYGPASFLAMLSSFGFGRPTGVLAFGPRGVLLEDSALARSLPRQLERDSLRRMAANGLGPLDVTPMQLARATAGLASGRLPRVRLVRSIGARDLPRASEELEVRAQHLERVRSALRRVVSAPDGSAHQKGLDPRTLGFTVALKTGSADFTDFLDPRDDPRFGSSERREGRMRKHTWIAGWLPAEEPRFVLVVYLHDVAETASRTATHLASQFLRTPKVRAFLAQELGPRGPQGRGE